MMPSHRPPTRAAVVALLLLTPSLAPALQAQSFEGIITVNSSMGGKKPVVQVISAKGSRWRMDSNMGGGPMGPGTVLADGEGHVTMLVASRKMYVRPPYMQQAVKNDALKDYSFAPTGKKDHVLDYDCEYYQVRNAASPNKTSEWCITSALGFVGFAPVRELSDGTFLRKSFPKGFFVVKAVDEKGKVSYEVAKVERKKLDDSLFVPPPDYTEMKTPGMGGMPGPRRP